jgi:hypothetical protein
VSTWVILAAAAIAYVGLMLLVAGLLRRNRRELDRQWADLESWERAMHEAARRRQEGR